MRATSLSVLLVFAGALSASAGDCPEWRRFDLATKNAEVAGMISGQLSSNASKKYTSENKVAIQRCLKNFAPQIVEEIDQACTDRPGASAEFVDDIFDRYFLSCI
ncbi:MAG TPA: hypothetical protein VII72_10815 [Myxococcota bacterium]|jgi:hypothetical protein